MWRGLDLEKTIDGPVVCPVTFEFPDLGFSRLTQELAQCSPDGGGDFHLQVPAQQDANPLDVRHAMAENEAPSARLVKRHMVDGNAQFGDIVGDTR